MACTVLVALAGYLAVHFQTSGPGSPRCVVRAAGQDGDRYEIEPQQAVNAATIAAVGSARRLPERAVTIALATAMQESGLRNIRYGDRDSLGLFQQRPTQGWGTPEQIMDPVYSAGAFYDHLVKVPGYSRLPLTVAAQEVQRSGFPQAYAKHEPDAALLTSALTGRAEASLSCAPGAQEQPGDPVRVQEKLRRDFGKDVLAGTEGAGRVGGAGKSGPSGPVVSVPVPDREQGGPERRGWELAHWAVAHSRELRIAQVSYAGRVWSASNSGNDWRPETPGISAEERKRAAAAVVITTVQ